MSLSVPVGTIIGLLQGISKGSTVEARKLEHSFRRISARIAYTLPKGHEDNDVPTFWLLLY